MESMLGPTNLDWRFKGECRTDPEPFNTFPDVSLNAKDSLILSQIEEIESEVGYSLSLIDEEGVIDRMALMEIHKQIKGINSSREKAAKAICGRCIVREKCLTWAIDKGEPGGIWGGLNERERNKLVRRGYKIAS